MKNLLLASTLSICVAFTAIGVADDKGPHDDSIKVRQAMFQLYGFNFGILSDMAKEKRDYDADLAAASAANLLSAATLRQDAFWPPGSDSETDGNARTRALPAIWETFPEITEKADALKTAATTMNEVAGNGLDALQGAVKDVGASCKGCHDDFRAEKK